MPRKKTCEPETVELPLKPMPQPIPWLTLEDAAKVLGSDIRVLRDLVSKHAKKSGEFTEASFNGILARKFGGRWRINLKSWRIE